LSTEAALESGKERGQRLKLGDERSESRGCIRGRNRGLKKAALGR